MCLSHRENCILLILNTTKEEWGTTRMHTKIICRTDSLPSQVKSEYFTSKPYSNIFTFEFCLFLSFLQSIRIVVFFYCVYTVVYIRFKLLFHSSLTPLFWIIACNLTLNQAKQSQANATKKCALFVRFINTKTRKRGEKQNAHNRKQLRNVCPPVFSSTSIQAIYNEACCERKSCKERTRENKRQREIERDR